MTKTNHYGQQCNWIKDNHGTITIQYLGAGQSKDDLVKGRVEPDLKKEISAFCLGRQISESDFILRFTRLGPAYFDLTDALVDHAEFLVPFLRNADQAIPLLKRLSEIISPVCDHVVTQPGHDENEG